MSDQNDFSVFGPVAECTSLSDVCAFITQNAAHPTARMKAVCFGLALVARGAVRGTAFFEDTKHVLDEIANAKAALDVVSWHTIAVTRVTAAILFDAQCYFDEQVIPCTEWPTPEELANVVAEAAKRHSMLATI